MIERREKGGRWWWQGFGEEDRGQDLFALRVGGPMARARRKTEHSGECNSRPS
jgi:hypothetical protein